MGLDIHGEAAPEFAAVRDAFADNFRERGDVGAAVAVVLDGRVVVDLWGGLADVGARRPWRSDTLAHVFSVSKPFAALCALVLVDRGELHLDAPVTDVWPEFGRHGKDEATVRMVLAHAVGLPALGDPHPLDTLLDWERMVEVLAAEPPVWPPGTAHGEHALLYGHLVGELVRRVSGRSLGAFLREEIAAPWSLDLHVGLGEPEQARAATLLDPGAWGRDVLAGRPALFARALENPPGLLDVGVVNSPAWRAAEIPAVNAHATALAVARFYGGLALGGALDGVRLVRPETVEEMTRGQAEGRDVLLEREVRWGLGVQLEGTEFGMGGVGGSDGWGDRRRGLGVGYVTNTMGGHDRSTALYEAVRSCVPHPAEV